MITLTNVSKTLATPEGKHAAASHERRLDSAAIAGQPV
jgi:hypothetical protein